jgi:thiamine biosynthesis lipoprotein
VDAWGFGPSGVTDEPGDDLLDGLLASTGFQLLELDPDRSFVSKRVPEVQIDLSAIAKGYAVDRVAELLEASARSNFMVEIGGEVRVGGRNARGSEWRIGIERPDDARRTLYTSIALDGLALATSGDYRNFFIRDGVRLSHTIDPRTGRPVAHDLASVSVVHARCVTADALATGLEVLGPAEGPAFADRQGIAALFMVREQNGGTYREIVSESWRRLFEIQPAGENVDS